ncbi:MAG: hypothetical protein JW778_02800 [Candidatus Altiarchaeota archaeon]|nr:hypothetical protein [Candidatus Altiarchaeota archaeon]
MHFIKEIIQRNPEKEYIHKKFIKYGRGEFQGPIMTIRNEGNMIKISSSDDYVNSLGWIMTKDSRDEFNISGSIISWEDITSHLSENNITVTKSSKKKGVYTLQVKGSVPAENLSKIYSEFPDAQILLDLNPAIGRENLKTKKKPQKLGSGFDQKFCSAVFDIKRLKSVIDEFCFDLTDEEFKGIHITHRYSIGDIIIPEEYMGNYAMARIHAKRKGLLKRTLEVDGKKTEKEHEFIV